MSTQAARFTESVVEQAASGWLESLNYRILAGPEIAPGKPRAIHARLHVNAPGIESLHNTRIDISRPEGIPAIP